MPYPTRSSTKIIKNVVCRVLVVISLLLSLVSCEKEQDKVEDGVSLELAKERKANIGGVTYKLYFSIPADRSEAIMAESTIFFELFDLVPVILDFKEAKERIFLPLRLRMGEKFRTRLKMNILLFNRNT